MTDGGFPSRLLGGRRSLLVSGSVAFLIAFGVLPPLVRLGGDGSGPRGDLESATAAVWQAPATWALFGRSVLMAAGVTVLAVLSGCLEALVFFRGRFAGRRLLFLFSLFPLFVPPALVAVGLVRFSETCGQVAERLGIPSAGLRHPILGPGATVLVLWVGLRPFVTICAGASLRSAAGEMEECALLDASPARVAARLSLRLAAPGILVGALIVLLRSGLEVAVPSVFQVRAYAFEAFAMLAAFYDEASALAYATPLLALGVAAGVAAGLAAQRDAAGGLSFERPAVLIRRGGARTLGVLLCAVTAAPFWILAGWAALRPVRLVRALGAVWPTVWDEIARTGLDSAATSVLALGAAFLAASAGCYGSRTLRPVIKGLFTLPLLLPPVLLAVGMVLFWNQPGWRGAAASTPAVLLTGRVLLLLPFLGWAMAAILLTVDRSQIEALALDGGGWSALGRHLLYPAVRPHLPLLGLAAFLLSFGEFEAGTLLAPPGWTPFSVRLFSLLHYGVDDVVAGLALTGFLFSVVFAFVASRLAQGEFLPD